MRQESLLRWGGLKQASCRKLLIDRSTIGQQAQNEFRQAMKTLLFCTSYAERQGVWNERWQRWLKAVLGSGLKADQILIVDDGSPVLPDWPGVVIVSANSAFDDNSKVAIHHFPDRRGQRWSA